MQEIQFLKTECRTIKDAIENKSAYRLRSDRGWLWLQRACFWVLNKIGAYQLDDRVEMRRVVINADTFIERLFQQEEELAEVFNQESPEVLLIGSRDYERLMREIKLTSPFEFRAQYLNYEKAGRRTCGLKVCVLPWMTGAIAVPRRYL